MEAVIMSINEKDNPFAKRSYTQISTVFYKFYLKPLSDAYATNYMIILTVCYPIYNVASQKASSHNTFDTND